MKLYKLLTHELSLVLIVKFILLYLLWFLFFSHPAPRDEEREIIQHIFGVSQNMTGSNNVKE